MLNLRQKLYQMFILGTDGNGYEPALKNNLGGMIFFTPDIKSESQFKKLINKCNSIAYTPPFLSIDQEGGRVERTENIHNGKKYLSAKFAFQKGEKFLKTQTSEIAKELKNYGINLNFAPCIDVNTNPNNPIIGERAFSSLPDEVIKGGKIVAEIYRQNGICPCVKHFPGHGDANSDSHKTLPEITIPFENLEQNHIRPFKALINDNIEMVMIAHLHIPHFENEFIPTSLSENAINYLRNDLNFRGITISDDMIMQGVADFGKVKACEMGIRAGLNMFIYRNSNTETLHIIEEIYKLALTDNKIAENIEKSFNIIQSVKSKFL